MNNISPDQFYSGVRNLLFNCGECTSGQTLLIIHENTTETYFEPELALAVSGAAQELGLTTEFFEVGVVNDVSTPNPALSAKIQQADKTLYLARMGDQIRFHPSGAAGTQIVSYALDRDMLVSSFGNADYRAFVAIKNLINQAMTSANDIHVTCPAGTDFKGGGVAYDKDGGDVTIKRFPLSVFTPAPAKGLKGRIAQVGFLVGTGSRYYHPYACELTDTLFVDFEDNRITGFDGSPKDVAAARHIMNASAKSSGSTPTSCTLGTQVSTLAAITSCLLQSILNAGAAVLLVIPACCTFTPVANTHLVKSRLMWLIRLSGWMASQYGKTVCCIRNEFLVAQMF